MQDVEGAFADDGEVFGVVILAVAGPVFVEGGVEHPVDAVLDAPVGANGFANRSAVSGREEREKWRERLVRPSRSTVASSMAMAARPGMAASPGERRSDVSQPTSWLSVCWRTSVRP